MQTAIFILVILTLIRGALIIGKALSAGSIEKQIKVAEEKLEVIKNTKSGVFVFSVLFVLTYGIFLFSLSIYILFQFV